ncbi:MAG: acyltransferase family protein [Lachnospiraceae bacterium]|nr:acyltransferase family protein [Lachnospiraceae bacterium]
MKKLINLTMFDLLKGVAMLGVVFGHSFGGENAVLGDVVGKILYSLLMPAFFVVSGYWLKKKEIKVGVKTSFEYLFVPFVIVVLLINLVGLGHRLLQNDISSWLNEFLIPSLLVSTAGANRVGPMWFVFALFLAWCLFYIVISIKNQKVQWMLVLLAAIIGGALMPFKLPFQIAQGLVAFSFVYCGYILKKKKLLDAKQHPLVYIVMFLAWICTVVFGSMNMYAYDVDYGIVSIIGSLCGALIIIKLFLYINLLEWYVLDGIRWVGRYSMWFLCIHAVEHAVFPWKILFRFVEQGTVIGSLTQFLLRLIFIIVGCIVFQNVQRYWIRRKEKSKL